MTDLPDHQPVSNSPTTAKPSWSLRWINEPNLILLVITLMLLWVLSQWTMSHLFVTPALKPVDWNTITTDQLGIDLNTATQFQLMQVEGIGETLAQRIIDYRIEHGAFESLEQLLDVPGIGEKTLKTIRLSVHIRQRNFIREEQ